MKNFAFLDDKNQKCKAAKIKSKSMWFIFLILWLSMSERLIKLRTKKIEYKYPPVRAICTSSLTCTSNSMGADCRADGSWWGGESLVARASIFVIILKEEQNRNRQSIIIIIPPTIFIGTSVVPMYNMVVYLTKHSLISIAVSS